MKPTASYPAITRQEQKLITRQKLLDTTIDIISVEGMTGLTLAKVAERAGLSRGICNFHFQTKEQLMLEAFQTLYREHEQAWRAIVEDDRQSPAERLNLLIRTLLTPPLADPRKLAVWLAFWGVAPHRQTYIDLCTEGDCLYEQAIEELLRQLSPGQQEINGLSLKTIAVWLTAMIDGIHLQYLIAPGRLTPDEAIRACQAFLGSYFQLLQTEPDGT